MGTVEAWEPAWPGAWRAAPSASCYCSKKFRKVTGGRQFFRGTSLIFPQSISSGLTLASPPWFGFAANGVFSPPGTTALAEDSWHHVQEIASVSDARSQE